ncbi:unnamed protein product [Amoebophrya sp. A120]|nr:unnamed protein product [Amoebophrya sp. A120]|eukprot:GSA120T00000374001.1
MAITGDDIAMLVGIVVGCLIFLSCLYQFLCLEPPSEHVKPPKKWSPPESKHIRARPIDYDKDQQVKQKLQNERQVRITGTVGVAGNTIHDIFNRQQKQNLKDGEVRLLLKADPDTVHAPSIVQAMRYEPADFRRERDLRITAFVNKTNGVIDKKTFIYENEFKKAWSEYENGIKEKRVEIFEAEKAVNEKKRRYHERKMDKLQEKEDMKEGKRQKKREKKFAAITVLRMEAEEEEMREEMMKKPAAASAKIAQMMHRRDSGLGGNSSSADSSEGRGSKKTRAASPFGRRQDSSSSSSSSSEDDFSDGSSNGAGQGDGANSSNSSSSNIIGIQRIGASKKKRRKTQAKNKQEEERPKKKSELFPRSIAEMSEVSDVATEILSGWDPYVVTDSDKENQEEYDPADPLKGMSAYELQQAKLRPFKLFKDKTAEGEEAEDQESSVGEVDFENFDQTDKNDELKNHAFTKRVIQFHARNLRRVGKGGVDRVEWLLLERRKPFPRKLLIKPTLEAVYSSGLWKSATKKSKKMKNFPLWCKQMKELLHCDDQTLASLVVEASAEHAVNAEGFVMFGPGSLPSTIPEITEALWFDYRRNRIKKRLEDEKILFQFKLRNKFRKVINLYRKLRGKKPLPALLESERQKEQGQGTAASASEQALEQERILAETMDALQEKPPTLVERIKTSGKQLAIAGARETKKNLDRAVFVASKMSLSAMKEDFVEFLTDRLEPKTNSVTQETYERKARASSARKEKRKQAALELQLEIAALHKEAEDYKKLNKSSLVQDWLERFQMKRTFKFLGRGKTGTALEEAMEEKEVVEEVEVDQDPTPSQDQTDPTTVLVEGAADADHHVHDEQVPRQGEEDDEHKDKVRQDQDPAQLPVPAAALSPSDLQQSGPSCASVDEGAAPVVVDEGKHQPTTTAQLDTAENQEQDPRNIMILEQSLTRPFVPLPLAQLRNKGVVAPEEYFGRDKATYYPPMATKVARRYVPLAHPEMVVFPAEEEDHGATAGPDGAVVEELGGGDGVAEQKALDEKYQDAIKSDDDDISSDDSGEGEDDERKVRKKRKSSGGTTARAVPADSSATSDADENMTRSGEQRRSAGTDQQECAVDSRTADHDHHPTSPAGQLPGDGATAIQVYDEDQHDVHDQRNKGPLLPECVLHYEPTDADMDKEVALKVQEEKEIYDSMEYDRRLERAEQDPYMREFIPDFPWPVNLKRKVKTRKRHRFDKQMTFEIPLQLTKEEVDRLAKGYTKQKPKQRPKKFVEFVDKEIDLEWGLDPLSVARQKVDDFRTGREQFGMTGAAEESFSSSLKVVSRGGGEGGAATGGAGVVAILKDAASSRAGTTSRPSSSVPNGRNPPRRRSAATPPQSIITSRPGSSPPVNQRLGLEQPLPYGDDHNGSYMKNTSDIDPEEPYGKPLDQTNLYRTQESPKPSHMVWRRCVSSTTASSTPGEFSQSAVYWVNLTTGETQWDSIKFPRNKLFWTEI